MLLILLLEIYVLLYVTMAMATCVRSLGVAEPAQPPVWSCLPTCPQLDQSPFAPATARSLATGLGGGDGPHEGRGGGSGCGAGEGLGGEGSGGVGRGSGLGVA